MRARPVASATEAAQGRMSYASDVAVCMGDVRFLPPFSLSLSGKAALDAVRPDPTGDGA